MWRRCFSLHTFNYVAHVHTINNVYSKQMVAYLRNRMIKFVVFSINVALNHLDTMTLYEWLV